MLVSYSATHLDKQLGRRVTTGKQRLDCDLCYRSSPRIPGGMTTPEGWADRGGNVHHCPECVAGYPETADGALDGWTGRRLSDAYEQRRRLVLRMPGHSPACDGVWRGGSCCAIDGLRRTRMAEMAHVEAEAERLTGRRATEILHERNRTEREGVSRG